MEKTIIFLSSNTLDLLKKAEYVSNLSEKEIIEKAIFRYCRYLITTQAKKALPLPTQAKALAVGGFNKVF